jgi:hypothetical protein
MKHFKKGSDVVKKKVLKKIFKNNSSYFVGNGSNRDKWGTEEMRN